ncbi:hypothetical protein D3C80_1721600 [compost metagenome]
MQRLVETAAIRLTLGANDAGIARQGNGGFRQAVLLVGVQLTIMSHQAEWLRHRRMRVGIGGKASVEVHGVYFMTRINQIAEVRHDLRRIETAFENLCACAERQWVKA